MARKRKGRDINGIFLLDKDKGISSNFALQQIKRLFFAKKAGHTGSLDPLATGILPICLGEATKFASFLLADDKSYAVVAKLGATTTTLDSEGEVISRGDTTHIAIGLIEKVVLEFVGKIKQIPPMYSALKKDGVPLYKLARKGIEIKREAREITIFSIKIIKFEKDELTLQVDCSKGTYIRTLVDDIGNKLGCGAFVKELRRNKFADFDICQTLTFDKLKLDQDSANQFKNIDSLLIKTEDILTNFSSIQLNEQQAVDISFGREIKVNCINQTIKIFAQEKFIGIGKINDNILYPKKLMVYPD